MKEYLSEVGQVLTEQNTRLEGLSSAEASERLQKHGANKLAEGKKESIFVKFLKELADPMIIILLVAAVISSITEYIPWIPITTNPSLSRRLSASGRVFIYLSITYLISPPSSEKIPI